MGGKLTVVLRRSENMFDNPRNRGDPEPECRKAFRQAEMMPSHKAHDEPGYLHRQIAERQHREPHWYSHSSGGQSPFRGLEQSQ
ncbi:MAG: hypothetical protein IPP98_03295 [Gemmatimonadetes bacterium]|nr:hypothetical protein [Gemmatimonadota bacterium]MBP7619898.1 hypothetical protein [Gemmatimonadales bacterium]